MIAGSRSLWKSRPSNSVDGWQRAESVVFSGKHMEVANARFWIDSFAGMYGLCLAESRTGEQRDTEHLG